MEKAALAGYINIARIVYERPWAVLPATLAVIEEVVRLRIEGYRFTDEEIAERLVEAQAAPQRQAPAGTPGALAVIPLQGVLMPKANVMSAMSGGTSLQQFQTQFKAALDSPDVAGILLDVDSPGGSVSLVPETADMVYAARDVKPVVAFANTMAASAAYYIASQAEEFYVTPSGEVGSIGVLMAHDDLSGMAEQMGVNRTYISAPEGGNKTEGNPYGPLSEETVAFYQAEVDAVYDGFVAAVSRGRIIFADTVRGPEFGQGRMLMASDAFDARMVDGVATFDQTLIRLSQMTRGTRGWQAASDFRLAVAYGSLKAEPEQDKEIPALPVAAGETGGTAATSARLRGRRIGS